MQALDGRSIARSFRVKLLGAAQISCDEERIERRLSTRTLLAFAMLITRPGEILKREELAFTIWPDESEDDARANLRRHLYLLQQALRSSAKKRILADARTVCWAAAADAWLDVSEFERLSATSNGVEAAIDLYTGDFLPHIDHEWVIGVRSRLRTLLYRDIERAITLRRAQDDLIGSLRYVEKLLMYDPWREDALCDLMLLRYRIGDRAGALESYREFRHRLRRDFGVDPMPETVGLHDIVVRGQIPSDLLFKSSVDSSDRVKFRIA